MKIRTNTAPMLTQSANTRSIFPIEGMRLLDGESEAEKTAREAETARVAAETEAARVAAAKVEADAAKVIKDAADAAAAEAERIRLSTLSATEADLLKDAMKQKKIAKDAKDALEAANARLALFDGIDPAEAATLAAAAKTAKVAAAAADEAALVAKGDWERLKTSMATTHKTELDAATAVAATKDTALKSAMQVIDDLTVGAKFSNSAYVKEETVLPPSVARQVFGTHFDLVDGVVTGYDKPRGAKDRTPIVDASGDALDFELAMAKLIEVSPDRDSLKRAGIKTGSGPRTPLTTPGVTTIPAKRADGELRGAARIQAALESGALKKPKN